MNNSEIILFITLFVLFIVDCYFYYLHYKEKIELKDRVDDLEKQIVNISKTSAEFFCATNNRIADISTAVDELSNNFDVHCDINRMNFDFFNTEFRNIRNPFKRFLKW